MRAAPRFFVVTAIAITVGVCAAFSCKTFDLPNDTCDPSKLHGGMLSGDASDTTCNRCLENNCCEEVGICSRTKGCTQVVSDVQACVVDAGRQGAQMETECATNKHLVAHTPADDAYRCMRSNCGDSCGLPVCKVDRSGILIQSAKCDSCFSSSCCGELNACYRSRACKLIVECIATTCGTELGDSLAGAPLSILAGIDAGMFDICDGGAGPMDGSDAGVPQCVSSCVCTYKTNDQGLPPEDPNQSPDRLALAVYTCGQDAHCADKCLSADGGSDAASEAGDASVDASADAP